MLPVEHSIVSKAFACGVHGFSHCECPEVPGPPDFSRRNSHGWATTKHRLLIRSLDGRAVGALTYYDGALPAELSEVLGLWRSQGKPTGCLLSVHASPHVARRLGVTGDTTLACPLLGGPCGIVSDTALGAHQMVAEATVREVLDVEILLARFGAWFAEWEREHPPEATPPYTEDADRDHAVSVWRTPDGECYARSVEEEASGGTFPEAVERLFRRLYPEPA